MIFDGHKVHSSDAFQGTRISLIFFTHTAVDRCSRHELDRLREMGFRPDSLLVPPQGRGRRLRVLYLFSGASRKSSIKECLIALCKDSTIFTDVLVNEVDVLNDPLSHDLMDEDRRLQYIHEVATGQWHIAIVTPSCSTWTRAVYANTQGPRPVRSRDYPLGFPWLSGWLKSKAEVGTVLGLFAASILGAVKRRQQAISQEASWNFLKTSVQRVSGCRLRCASWTSFGDSSSTTLASRPSRSFSADLGLTSPSPQDL